ncbi:C1 family peptidase [Bacteriovoracaceae bacterium]|nr:C1 family peptidase [Bacteriovoracaceae bacterium]
MRLLFILLLSISIHAFEEIPSSQIDFRPPVNDSENLVLPLQSNISEALKFHTEVKSQGKRGACTIFSSIGYFESLLMRDGLVGNDIDLSEEWLEYVVMTRQDDEGSTSNRNFKKSLFFGLVSESTWPYLGLKLYYGSWNSSKTELHDIQPRDKNKWFDGIVGYPAPGSRDRRISGEKGGGHSILVVGYDYSIEITNKLLMDDGTYKEVKTSGAYLIKNSWGQKGFGKNFTFKGQSLPGFGWVSQEYANELGTFYSLVR